MADFTDVSGGLTLAWLLHRNEMLPSLEIDAKGGLHPKSTSPEFLRRYPGLGGIFREEGGKQASLLAWAVPPNETLPLEELLFPLSPPDDLKCVVIDAFALKEAKIAVADYGFWKFAAAISLDGHVENVDGLWKDILPASSADWGGCHFHGKLAWRKGGADALSQSTFLTELLPENIHCRGTIRSNGEIFSVAISLHGAKGAFALRSDSDWGVELERVSITSLATRERKLSDRITFAGALTLATRRCEIEATADFPDGMLHLAARPEWNVDLNWLKSLVGAEDFAGVAQILESQERRTAGALFCVKELTCAVQWKPAVAARGLSLELSSPIVGGQNVGWEILGGKLAGSMAGYWSKNGDRSSFDCSLEGTWKWDAVQFDALLDTRSGEFRAALDVSDQEDELERFARKKLFPRAEPAKGEQKAGRPPTGGAGESAEIRDIKARLAKPFAVHKFDVSGNYREKSIAVRLETAGYWGFRLRGNDADRHRVDVRFGDLVCGGTYDQSGEDAAWSLQVEGTFALLRGGEPAALGGGARVTGTFGNTISSELTLTIESFNIREFVGLLLADEPPAAFPNIKLSDLQIVWKSGEKFTLKCRSDIPIFGPVVLKGMDLDVYSGEQKGKKKPNSGSAKIAFGKKLTVELKVSFEEKQIKFIGSAKDVDVSDLIDGFFREKPEEQKQASPVVMNGEGGQQVVAATTAAAKDAGRITAKVIQVEFWTARKRKKGAEKEPESKPEKTAVPSGEDAEAAEKFKEGDSLTVTLTVARGDSEMKLLLLAKAFGVEEGRLEWRVLFAGDLNLKLNGLPLIGDILGSEADRFAVGLHALHLKTGGKAGEAANDKVLKGLFARGGKEIDLVWWTTEERKNPRPLKEGFVVEANIGALPASRSTSPEKKVKDAEAKAADAILEPKGTEPLEGKDLTWKNTALKVGPVQLSRIGYGTKKVPAAAGKREGFMGVVAIDAALDLKALRLAVIGLGLEVDIPSFQVTPRIEGLAINVRNGPVEVTGSLVHRDGTYSGLAQIKTASMTLGAVGRFSMRDNRPSFFIYCVYASPLGGPPAFFVEGLAGGMGYDTRLVLPEIEDVPKFALVESAQNGLGGDPEKKLAAFDAAIVAAPNNLWIAAGVKFSSFKILNSVVVVALSIGDAVEVDIFGVMSLRMPPQIGKSDELLPIVASADLAIRGKISPSKGEVWLRGQIMPGAFLFEKDCRIVGGFAFQMWFSGEHKGDFVATVGGYHPKFKKPAHYFDVPRFGIDWQLTKEISIKGGAYFAITSRALMAGGRLEMLYQSGSVRASFVAEAHFLAAWAPLQYMADVRIAVDASFTLSVWGWSKEFNVHVAAELHLEGPPFSGYAKIELGPIDISIEFGSAGTPKAMTWPEFEKNFLPKEESMLSLRSVGLNEDPETAKDTTARRRWILSPGQAWELAIETPIPVKSIFTDEQHPVTLADGVMTDFYAVPTKSKVTSSDLTISVRRDDGTMEKWSAFARAFGMDIAATKPIVNPAAPALWSHRLPDADGKKAVDEDPRLNPAAEKVAQGVFGVVLSGRPPVLTMDAMEFKPRKAVHKILSRQPSSKRVWTGWEENFFAEETGDVYQRNLGILPARVK